MFCNKCGNEINENARFCNKCGSNATLLELPQKREIFTFTKILLLIGGLLLLSLIGLTIYLWDNSDGQTVNSQSNSISSLDNRNEEIASSVVNIVCSTITENIDDAVGGSGTIITTDGLVLTNAHIIPQGEEASLNEKSCVVILPDPMTGNFKEMYYAKPVIIPEISDEYDLAFVQIDDVYIDPDDGTVYGEYPKLFPAYDSEKYCTNENVKLGEPVRVYGYPSISGGYALTITDGVVSSLLVEDGLIITSAKISHGNSGGLAVDHNGCRIGIPSMATGDENESLGIIISNDLIAEFISKVE